MIICVKQVCHKSRLIMSSNPNLITNEVTVKEENSDYSIEVIQCSALHIL